ncbi:MAG TPA: TetR/AcrR family transcriptional regulator [Planctomycetota bacterium]|nr:TetR/AcrR family transcriptional regulator [Planctomycetota bacterium]
MRTTGPRPAPRQERSRQARQRILAAAMAELQRCPFEELSLRRVAQRAKVALSSFYNLYPAKAALLPDLYEHHRADLADRLAALLEPDQWRDADLATLVEGIVTRLVRMHREQRGLLRALVLRAHGRPESEAISQPKDMRDVVPAIAALVATRADGIRRRPAAAAAATGFVAVLAFVRECVLFPRTTAHVLALDDERLAADASALWLAFLDTPTARQR